MEKYDFSKHLFRASSFGELMAGQGGLTDKQKITLEGLIAKEKLTPKQEETKNDLIKKRDTIELSKGAKTTLRKMRREIKFKRRKQLVSKYLEKGIKLEEDALTFLSIYHGKLFKNNKDRVENEWFSGEVDVIEGFDTKVAYELNTLPDIEEPLKSIYEFQNRVYMNLHDMGKWTTSSIVLNMLDTQIADLLYRESFKPEWQGNGLPEWKKIELISFYIYDEENFYRLLKLNDCLPDAESSEKAIDAFNNFVEIPDHERIVEKTTMRDMKVEEKMKTVAELSRAYMQKIEDEMYEKQTL